MINERQGCMHENTWESLTTSENRTEERSADACERIAVNLEDTPTNKIAVARQGKRWNDTYEEDRERKREERMAHGIIDNHS